MIKPFLTASLLLAIFLSGCSSNTEPAQTNEAAKACEKIVQQFNQNLLSQAKSEKLKGWQLVLDNPTCFLSDAVKIAQTEISALQNQP
ncbi:MAG: hypothetical protein ACKO3J_04670 [Candidatus Nanopelagicus sp.]